MTIVLVGDSVTAISNEYGAFPADWVVDGVRGRTLAVNATSDNGLDAIARLRAAGVTGPRWIIALGLNDVYYQTTNVLTLQFRIRHAAAATGSTDVRFVAPYVNRQLSYRAALYLKTGYLRTALVRERVRLIRWDLAARPIDVYDGVHPTKAGAPRFAAALVAGEAAP